MSDVKRYSYVFHPDGSPGGRTFGLIQKEDGNLVSFEDYQALAAAHEQAWKSACSESHAWAREYEARMLVVAERDQLRAEVAMLRSYEAEWERTLNQLRAELEVIRGQQIVGRVHHNPDHPEPVRAVLNSAGRQLPDDARLYALPPQQPDTWPTLEKPAKVGAVLFNPGLSARLVVEAAQRQHEYSQQPEVEAARLERFGAFMQEVHTENGDGGASDGP